MRVLEDDEPGEVVSPRFSDVDPGEWWTPYVERLAELGVTKGCAVDPAEFCPNESVNRGQMATFLTRAFLLAPASSAGFADTEGSVYAGNIDALAAVRITRGCASELARFCPDDPVNRGQMATFLARALGLVPLPPPVTEEPVVPGAPVDPEPVVAPERVAFVSRVETSYEIFVVDADGTNRRQLTQNNDTGFPAFFGGPVWSPDGSRLAFRTRDVDGGNDWEISVAHADGSGVLQLTDNEWHDTEPAWSLDGRLAWVTMINSARIWVMDADGTNIHKLTIHKGDATPVWSPDGTRIAFARRSLVMEGDYEIWVMDADGGDQRQLTDNDRWDEEPEWSPDGTRVAFHARTIVYDGVERRYKSLDDSEIYVVNADDGSLQQLTDNEAGDYDPVWSPDGARIAFQSYRDGDYEIFVVDADGSNERQLTHNYVGDQHPEWSSDGTRIAFGGPGGIWVMDADGSNQKQLPRGPDHRPAWWGPTK